MTIELLEDVCFQCKQIAYFIQFILLLLKILSYLDEHHSDFRETTTIRLIESNEYKIIDNLKLLMLLIFY